MLYETPNYPGHLGDGLPLTENNLTGPLPELAMVIDLRVAKIRERQVPEELGSLVGRDRTGGHVVHKRCKPGFERRTGASRLPVRAGDLFPGSRHVRLTIAER